MVALAGIEISLLAFVQSDSKVLQTTSNMNKQNILT